VCDRHTVAQKESAQAASWFEPIDDFCVRAQALRKAGPVPRTDMRTHAYPLALAAALVIGGSVAEAHAGHHHLKRAHHQAVHPRDSADAMQRLLASDETVSFDSDSCALSPDAKHSLARFARQLEPEANEVRIEAIGYADSTGADPYNLLLAERRATAVLHYLHERGVSLLRMSAVSYGPGMPQMSNATAAGRAENRRVVIVVLPFGEAPPQA
jgi:outer membrane protein OmpA-like peptidoglycan-associated protein